MNDSPDTGVYTEHPAIQHAVYRQACAELMQRRADAIHRAGVNAMRDAARLFDATVGRQFTGSAPGMLQDDSRELSRWLASTPEAMRCARDAAAMAGTHRPAAVCVDTPACVCAAADSEGGEL